MNPGDEAPGEGETVEVIRRSLKARKAKPRARKEDDPPRKKTEDQITEPAPLDPAVVEEQLLALPAAESRARQALVDAEEQFRALLLQTAFTDETRVLARGLLVLEQEERSAVVRLEAYCWEVMLQDGEEAPHNQRAASPAVSLDDHGHSVKAGIAAKFAELKGMLHKERPRTPSPVRTPRALTPPPLPGSNAALQELVQLDGEDMVVVETEGTATPASQASESFPASPAGTDDIRRRTAKKGKKARLPAIEVSAAESSSGTPSSERLRHNSRTDSEPQLQPQPQRVIPFATSDFPSIHRWAAGDRVVLHTRCSMPTLITRFAAANETIVHHSQTSVPEHTEGEIPSEVAGFVGEVIEIFNHGVASVEGRKPPSYETALRIMVQLAELAAVDAPFAELENVLDYTLGEYTLGIVVRESLSLCLEGLVVVEPPTAEAVGVVTRLLQGRILDFLNVEEWCRLLSTSLRWASCLRQLLRRESRMPRLQHVRDLLETGRVEEAFAYLRGNTATSWKVEPSEFLVYLPYLFSLAPWSAIDECVRRFPVIAWPAVAGAVLDLPAIYRGDEPHEHRDVPDDAPPLLRLQPRAEQLQKHQRELLTVRFDPLLEYFLALHLTAPDLVLTSIPFRDMFISTLIKNEEGKLSESQQKAKVVLQHIVCNPASYGTDLPALSRFFPGDSPFLTKVLPNLDREAFLGLLLRNAEYDRLFELLRDEGTAEDWIALLKMTLPENVPQTVGVLLACLGSQGTAAVLQQYEQCESSTPFSIATYRQIAAYSTREAAQRRADAVMLEQLDTFLWQPKDNQAHAPQICGIHEAEMQRDDPLVGASLAAAGGAVLTPLPLKKFDSSAWGVTALHLPTDLCEACTLPLTTRLGTTLITFPCGHSFHQACASVGGCIVCASAGFVSLADPTSEAFAAVTEPYMTCSGILAVLPSASGIVDLSAAFW